ncbi:ribonuclease H-like domain-containing protein [Talaromyces proteolyticus]|uniref:Ribonuclease H-like domain-containing protein n=1 Tax=Talaromyces proteolyticus TaxID=1131652 RepID=A0AAD4KMZ1_9EURO|nr:ribonuclease H-like domain-containing protein [Talaromyces proteolyticus]KAH8696358.1 ribonuclease H-like domain-containing protein [Talaromyces proteolyticus]
MSAEAEYLNAADIGVIRTEKVSKSQAAYEESSMLERVSNLTIQEPNKGSDQTNFCRITSSLVNTTEGISDLVDSICDCQPLSPSLYLDLEGEQLSRNGKVSILQIFIPSEHHVYLVDVHSLGQKAFSTKGNNRLTLQDILESVTVQKAIFDVRNDSDALYSHFGIRLSGIDDIQLMELACRPFGRKFVNGLTKCIEHDAMLTDRERQVWKATKEKGLQLFAPEKGGSYDVFNYRPLDDIIQSYCVQDVQFLPRLWSSYNARLSSEWRLKVESATRARIRSSQSPSYQPHGRHKALGPW